LRVAGAPRRAALLSHDSCGRPTGAATTVVGVAQHPAVKTGQCRGLDLPWASRFCPNGNLAIRDVNENTILIAE
jgi:hypothetical protein